MNKAIAALPDLLITGGIAAISYGAWLVAPAVGFITGGTLAIAAGVLAALNARNKKVEG